MYLLKLIPVLHPQISNLLIGLFVDFSLHELLDRKFEGLGS